MIHPAGEYSISLYGPDGSRKYLNSSERARALDVMSKLPVKEALSAQTLAWSGARVSEVLALMPLSFQIEEAVVSFRTLKRRRFCTREVPIPPSLMAALEDCFQLAAAQADPDRASSRIWRWDRTTAWRLIKQVMIEAKVFGRRSSPRGLRHGFGVGTLQSGVPLNLVQRWLGHARLSTTAIYADAIGPEERVIAARFWSAE